MNDNYEFNNYSGEPDNAEPYAVTYLPAKLPDRTPKRKRSGIMRVCAFILCCGLLSGAAAFGGVMYGLHYNKSADTENTANGDTVLAGQRPPSVLNVAHINTDAEMTAAEIYAAYVNSTVGITTSVTTNYFGHQTTSAASGSGFIITENGYIVTNYHVIEGATSITVTTYGNVAYSAELIGYDESNDLAILKIDAEGLTPVVIGKSDDLNVGDSVLAIGNPLGELTFSLTSGVVSALDRKVTLSSSMTMALIQTDCAINSGNSGGALFNMHGEVIGITNAKYSGSSSSQASIDNIGFAIPISDVFGTIKSIIETGTFPAPYIGISAGNAYRRPGSFYAISGAVVNSVEEGSPAEASGLQINDVIIAADGKKVSGSSDLESILSASEAGDIIKITIYRSGETFDAELTVGEQMKPALPDTSANKGAN